MSLILGKAIYSILTGDTSVSSYVNKKIYPIFAEDNIINPFIVYSRTNLNTFYSKDGLLYDEVSISVNVISDDYTENINISNAVRNALELKTGDYNGIYIYSLLFENATEDFGVDGYITRLDFTVKCK